MYLISSTNNHYDVTGLVNHEMLKIRKLRYLENRTERFYEIKKILTCASDDKF